MNNLKNITKFSDADFLTFLYAERDRIKSQEEYPGWSIWAIGGSVATLLYFIYHTVEISNNALDMELCYKIFSSFAPFILYFMCLYESTKSYDRGGSFYVCRLIDVAPILTLCYYMTVCLFLIALGIIIKTETYLVVLWGVVLVVFLGCLTSIIICRNKFVSSVGGFRFSHKSKWNVILKFLFSGIVLIPWGPASRTLTFGLSKEFECTISVIAIVFLLYIFLRILIIDNYSGKIDAVIDNYLYNGWDKSRTMRTYEEIILGKRPFELLQRRYYELIDCMKESSKVEERVIILKTIVKGTESFQINTEDLFCELNCCTDFIRRFIDLNRSFSQGITEMLSIKTAVLDNDFKAMLETMVASQDEFNATFDHLESVQTVIDEILDLLNSKISQSICVNGCPARHIINN